MASMNRRSMRGQVQDLTSLSQAGCCSSSHETYDMVESAVFPPACKQRVSVLSATCTYLPFLPALA